MCLGLTDGKQKVSKTQDKKNIIILFLFFIVIALLIIIIVLLKPATKKCFEDASTNERSVLFPMCKNDKISIIPDIEDQSNIFRELTLTEMKNIEMYVDEKFNFKRSNYNNPAYDTISIQNIELYLPNKEDALNFLDKSGKQPERQARVTIMHYPFNVTYYVIGPVENPTYHKILKFNDCDNPLNEYATGMSRLTRASKMEKFSKQFFIDMWSLMKDTYEDFEEYTTPEDLFKAGLTARSYANAINKDKEMWTRTFWNFPKNELHYIHAKKFSFITVFVNVTSINESEWDIVQVSIKTFFHISTNI